MRAKPILLAYSFVLLSVLVLAGCGGGSSSELRLSNYYRPGCEDCEAQAASLAALEQEFDGQLEVENIDVTKPKVERLVKALELGGHGVVIRGPRGEVLWKQGRKEVSLDETRAAVAELLATRTSA